MNELLIGAIDLSPYFAGFLYDSDLTLEQVANEICFIHRQGQKARQDTPCYINVDCTIVFGGVSAANFALLLKQLEKGYFTQFVVSAQWSNSTLVLIGIHERLAEF